MYSKQNLQLLEQRLDDDLSRTILKGALRVAEDEENPIRGNLVAAAMRELFSALLHNYAPDEQVKSCCWYEKETENGAPTRAQRQRYIIHGGLDSDYVKGLKIDVGSLQKSLSRTFEALNKATHVRENTVIYKAEELSVLIDQSVQALVNMMNAVDDCRTKTMKSVNELIIDETTNSIISETIGTIDEIATHHSIDEVYVDEIKTVRIDADYIWYKATGTIEAQLQWGSNSDVERGDGLVCDRSFPFECLIPATVDAPKEFEASMTELHVSDGGWWDNYYDPDDEPNQ